MRIVVIGYLMAFCDTISANEIALEKSRAQPWRDCHPAPLPRSLEDYEYGLFAGIVIPALWKVFQKALNTQTRVELALLACALECYYLANQQYPETLETLAADYPHASPRDPMNHEPWHYHRDQELGFRLYSVGEDGRDDGGDNDGDDIIWSVEAVAPKLPKFEYNG